MKFGTKINNDLYSEWRAFYIDYSILKRELKIRTRSHNWTSKDEEEFRIMLERELDKVHDFQKVKTAELTARLNDAELSVQRLVAEGKDDQDGQDHDTGDTERQHHRPATRSDGLDADSSDEDEPADADTDDESFDALEDRFHGLEEEVAILVADVHDLALYTKLNITGFMKILKKHDKQTGFQLKTTFIQNYLEKRPFYKYNWDALIVKLSKLYNLVRTRGHPIRGDSSAGGNQSAFVRQTTKYWVHPDNLVSLKLAILRHLPVLVFNPDKEYEPKDSAITSIYFDNEDLELYLGRLEKVEGAEAIRLRWYGDIDSKTIFVERKTHREDWTGEKSVKARFPLKEHLVNAFLRGEYTVDADFQQLVKKGKKTQQEVDAMIQLANEVQYSVLTRQLKPAMRSFYNRTAFQLPGDARVRISLDTELALVREDNWDGRIRSGDNWRRTDIGIDHAFEQVAADDKELFKYGVLEVKIQTQYGQQPPEWITELVKSHLVEAVPKFSKFVHGCATLLPNRVDLVPFWLPQMATDILKPDTGYLSVIERPPATTQSSFRGTPERVSSSGSRSPQDTYTEPISEGEEDENDKLLPAKDERNRMGLSGAEVEEAIAYRENMLQKAKDSPKRQEGRGGEESEEFAAGQQLQADSTGTKTANFTTGALSINPLVPASAFDETFKSKLSKVVEVKRRPGTESIGEVPENGSQPADGYGATSDQTDDPIVSRDWRAPPGKRIAVPVRIEPKVYFAAERTFLKWMNNAVFVGSIATALLNFIPPHDKRGLISAALFTFAALVSIAYALGIFLYRSGRLRAHRAEGLYYDKYGPTVLCAVLFLALATNIGLRVSEML
ncbi:VTC domain containing protein [Amanita muscaria]